MKTFTLAGLFIISVLLFSAGAGIKLMFDNSEILPLSCVSSHTHESWSIFYDGPVFLLAQ